MDSLNNTLETIHNLATQNRLGLVKWIWNEVHAMGKKVSDQFPGQNFWIFKQNSVLIVTTFVCASLLAVFLEYFRKAKTAPKYRILIATIVEPSSTPEDVAVNCTFGALSVGMKTSLSQPEVMDMWKRSGSEKKVVAVEDEEVLREMQRLADEKKIVNVLVRDVPTSSHASTTLAIGPALPADLAAFENFGRVIGQSKISVR